MVSVLALSAVGHGFKHWSGQGKDYEICICYLSTKYAALRSKSKDWLLWNMDNVSEWSNISTCRLLFQWASTIKVQLSLLIKYKMDIIIILLKYGSFLPWYCLKFAATHSLNGENCSYLKVSTRLPLTYRSAVLLTCIKYIMIIVPQI